MPASILGAGGSRFGTRPSLLVTLLAFFSQASVLPSAFLSRVIHTPSAGLPLAVSSTWLVIGEVRGLPSAV